MRVKITALFVFTFLILFISFQHHPRTISAIPPPVLVSTSDDTSSYLFIASEGTSLTLYARKALQLEITNQNIALDVARIVFAENRITNDLGNHMINLGQRVSISRKILSTYIQKSLELSPDDLLQWQVFADNAQFDLSHLIPLSQGVVTTNDEQNNKTSLPSISQSTMQQSGNEKISAPWYWWVVGGAMLACIVFILKEEKK